MTLQATPTRPATRAPAAVALAASAALVMTVAGPASGVSAQDALACDAEPIVMTTAGGIDFVRTPDACFTELPGWPYEPRYVEIDGLRQAYVDDGPADGEVVLLLHGQPSWSYLYRKMIPVLADAGYRVIAMDHLGMGRSDKPVDIEAYSYLGHNERLQSFVEALELSDINLFVQDWGSLIGLRTAGLDPERYATIAVGDGALPVIPAGFVPFPPVEDPDVLTDLEFTGAQIPPQQVPFYDGCEPILDTDPAYFGDWMAYAMTAESFMPSVVVEAMTWFDLPPEDEAAYDAPFPSRVYMAGPRVFPSLINEVPGTTAEAWAGLTAYEKPFLTLWASNDPGNLGSCAMQQRFIDNVPGAAGQPHDRLSEASHFLQDDQGTEIATRLVDWYGSLEGGPSAAARTTADEATCVPTQEAFPISTAITPGPTASAYYDTVSPFEYADPERTHVHRADFYGADSGDVTVSSRPFDGTHPSPYNIVTRERDEAFLYGAAPVPYVTRFDVDTGEVAWRTELPVIEDAFDWIGLVVTHGNGDLYAVHARVLNRIDADTGEILASAELPPPDGSEPDDIVYNGFNVSNSGLIVAKSFGRPAACEAGGLGIFDCVTDETPQPPSVIAAIDPETLEVVSSVEVPESVFGRPAITWSDGLEYIYLNAADAVYRVALDGTDLRLDPWRYAGFLKVGQGSPTSVAGMGDWVVFQTNGLPGSVPMTVHVVAQADPTVAYQRDPFTPAPGPSFVSSSLSADPETLRIYSQDTGRGQIAGLELVESSDGEFELVERWVVDQRTLNHMALIGPPEARVLVSTDAPDAVRGLLAGSSDYEEQVVWRAADTGEELARSAVLPPMFNGGPVTPGFDGTVLYLGLDGVIRELSTAGSNPVCER